MCFLISRSKILLITFLLINLGDLGREREREREKTRNLIAHYVNGEQQFSSFPPSFRFKTRPLQWPTRQFCSIYRFSRNNRRSAREELTILPLQNKKRLPLFRQNYRETTFFFNSNSDNKNRTTVFPLIRSKNDTSRI